MMSSMLLLVAVVQAADAPALTDALVKQGLRVTRIGSTGGLLGIGNVALMLGLEETRYDEVVGAIDRTCRTRIEPITGVVMVDPHLPYMAPTEVEVGGAIVFGVPVERFLRIPQETHDEEATAMTTSPSQPDPITADDGEHDMKLIVAVVKGDDVDAVIEALLTADHRLTRINTTGGFLRRGNATLLIGVRAAEVDEVIGLIEAACPSRTEPAPVEKGLPMYSATVFVLDTSHFARV
jgi:uncharacterized protein YaaQ